MPLREVRGEDLWASAIDDGNKRQVELGSVLPLECDRVVSVAQFVSKICEDRLALQDELRDN